MAAGGEAVNSSGCSWRELRVRVALLMMDAGGWNALLQSGVSMSVAIGASLASDGWDLTMFGYSFVRFVFSCQL